jgi:putative hydrolase of the HAD superfamily
VPGAERAVFFDAGNTLVHAWPSVGEVYAEVALGHGVSASPLALEAAFRKVWSEKDHENWRLGQNDPGTQKDEKAWWKRIVTRVFHGLPPFADFDAFFEELYVSFGKETRWRLYDEAREVLETLSARGVPMAVVSNWDSRLMSLLEQLDIARYFRTAVISAVVGSSKPERRIFQIACERMAVEPASVLHVGDNLEDDVAGAIAVGIAPVWIDRFGSPTPPPAGARKISDLREILAFL